ncbi:MAG: hypothetical protein J6R88_05975, partial [Clostridia bacterium]|nr:hypothetical protein [Clostridia bacterium]
MLSKEKLLEGLNAKSLSTRCKSLKKLLKLESFNSELAPVSKEIVPLHFSSNMYYSSYSPTLCAYLAHKCGCFALAVNDYATVSSYKELKKACEILKMPYACGYHVYTEPLFNEKKGVVFGYGVANLYQKALNEDLKEFRLTKLENVKKIIKRINKVLLPFNLSISEREVIDKKKVKKGGSVTEKDVAKHLAEKLVKKYGKGEELLKFLKVALRVDSCEKELPFLIETENTYFVEDLTKVIYLNYQIFQSKTKNKVVDSVLAI